MYKHKSGVVLRPVEKGDLETLLKLKMESWTGTSTTPFLSMVDQEEWHEKTRKSLSDLAMMIDQRENNRFTPTAICLMRDINWISRSLTLSGHVFADYRGDKKIVQSCFASAIDFCFEMLNMNRINTEPVITNAPAQKLIQEYLGFEFEGRKRQSVYKCGKYYDSIVLGLLRDDWEKQPRIMAYEGSCCLNWNPVIAEDMIQETMEIINAKYFDSDVILQQANTGKRSPSEHPAS